MFGDKRTDSRPHARVIRTALVTGGRSPRAFREGAVWLFKTADEVPATLEANSQELEPWRGIPLDAVWFDRAEFDAATAPVPPDPPPVPPLFREDIERELGWSADEFDKAESSGLLPARDGYSSAGRSCWQRQSIERFKLALGELGGKAGAGWGGR